jgi:hypothetical protein
MATCDEDVSNVNIPHDDRVEVNINQNETPDSSTINRGTNRLLANDNQLMEYLRNVALTSLSEGLSGCIKLTSPGCITLDLDYISKNICLSVTQLDGIIKLAELCDVCILDPVDGESLIWSEGNQCWKNEFAACTHPSGDFVRQTCVFEPITSHAQVDVFQAPAPTSGSFVETYSYNVSGFNNGWGVALEAIEGFYISCRNFGRVDFATTSGASWKVEVEYPDNTFYTINSHEAWNTDDDGGNAHTIFVPYTYSLVNKELKVRLNLENVSSVHYLDQEGIPMNFFKIIGAKVCDVGQALFPNMDFVHIKGMIGEGSFSTSGFIDNSTSGDPLYSTWTSLTADELRNDFSLVTPIVASPETAITELEFVGLLTEGIDVEDPGTDIESTNSLARAYITYDWLERTVRGHMMFSTGGVLTKQGTGIYNGILNEDVVIDATDFSGLDIRSMTEASLRRINKLPVISDSTGKIITRNVAYTIRHYKYKTTNSLEVRFELEVIDQPDYEPEFCGLTYVIRDGFGGTVNLPKVSSGCILKFVKDTDQDVTLQANAADTIANSSVGGTLVNAKPGEEGWANITLLGLDNDTWVLDGGHGTWVTS